MPPNPFDCEQDVLSAVLPALQSELNWADVVRTAHPWIDHVRQHPAPFWALESLLREFPISSHEGLALMRLAEALLRVPDMDTAATLTADQLSHAEFNAASHGPHKLLAGLSNHALTLAKKLLPQASGSSSLLATLGAQTVVKATVRAMGLLGQQFVLGRDITEALRAAATTRQQEPLTRFSFDMLGEGARTEVQAQHHLASYLQAMHHISGSRVAPNPQQADGISIKLSALFARYEEAQRSRVLTELVPRAAQLVDVAAKTNINLTLDAEESDRLDLSLDVFDALAQHVARQWPAWQGLGLAVQAYQTRALSVVDAVACMARAHRLKFMVRLVKGAYWDHEIKRTQILGLDRYPVFTHKHHTDVSYLACARELLAHAPLLYPQFATHNAGTIAAIMSMAQSRNAPFEFQRLHGMGQALYEQVMLTASAPLRVYAPVGEHRELLAYLVRRLLENGANSSFVRQLADDTLSTENLLVAPWPLASQAGVPLPRELYAGRPNSRGIDLASRTDRESLCQALATTIMTPVPPATATDIDVTMSQLHFQGFTHWSTTPLTQRVAVLRRAADQLEQRLSEFCGLLVREAQKTWVDSVAEVREAVDFCRYYAHEAEQRLVAQTLPGPTGESNELRLRGRGVFLCISPWNFPLAIFTGQVVAALVAGNAVAAKPAEQTPVVAQRMVELLWSTGVPRSALALLHGPGETVGAELVAHRHTAGVCFTGSGAVARNIHKALAARDGPILPLIAETGGINAMVVDSTALPEQVIDAVVQSAFQSAGQRCSALRLLCLHEGIAQPVLALLQGALQELVVGDPANLATDVPPLIDREAFENVQNHITRLRQQAHLIGETPLRTPLSHAVAPIAFEWPSGLAWSTNLSEEIFGPVLQVVRWSGKADDIIDRINALGYGLTLGLQTRIDGRAQRWAQVARAGNVYVNRNMTGAVVGVQPFGGEGLSGTGPKAGGPHYLYRFCTEQTLTINTTAAGGNAALLALPPLTPTSPTS